MSTSSPPHRIFITGMLLYGCFAAFYLARPPLGRDGWRESDVLMVARNFARQAPPIWLPQIDTQGPQPTVVGMEFPALNYVGSWISRAGIDMAVATRALVVAATWLAAASIFGLVHFLGTRREAREQSGAMAALAFLASPLVLRYGQAAQPDMAALALALFALLLLCRALQQAPRLDWRLYYASAACMALGIAMKLPVVVLGLPAVVTIGWRLGWRQACGRLGLWGYGPLALLPPILWYHHARHLQEVHADAYFNITRSGAAIWGDATSPLLYLKIIGRLCDVYACPLVLLAALTTLLRWRQLVPPMRAMVVAVGCYLIFAGQLGTHHFYYGLPVTAVVCLLAGCITLPWSSRRTQVLLFSGIACWGLWRCHNWFPPNALPDSYKTAQIALRPFAGPIQLLSQNDPTLLYLLDRCGWADTSIHADAVAYVIDLRRLQGPDLEAARASLDNMHCKPALQDALIEVWLNATTLGNI